MGLNHWVNRQRHLARSGTPDLGSRNAILETHNLTQQSGKLMAVDRLNISVALGEVFGLLSPNGAGKSTVIKMLTTLLPPTAGEATIAGFRITR